MDWICLVSVLCDSYFSRTREKEKDLQHLYGGDYNLIHATLLLLFFLCYKYDKKCISLCINLVTYNALPGLSFY